MTINLDTELAETAWDPTTRAHTYTLERQGKRWTVTIPDEELARFGPVVGAHGKTNQARRRLYVATKLAAAMQGEPDA